MRTYIYLDNELLKSYVAQIDNGLLQTHQDETEMGNTDKTGQVISAGAEGNADFTLLKKGVKGSLNIDGEHTKEHEHSDIVHMVETKALHDNAFDIFMKYADDHNLWNTSENKTIGDFVQVEDNFYIFDIDYYNRIFSDKEGVVAYINKKGEAEIRAKAKETFEQANNKEAQSSYKAQFALDNLVKQAIKKNSDENKSTGEIIKAFASVVPYHQILCISNYLVVLSQDAMRDSLSTIAFKYGGRVHIVGYITNKIEETTDTQTTTISKFSSLVNNTVKFLFPAENQLYIMHPIAIYYETSIKK